MCDELEAVLCRNRAGLLRALADETTDADHKESLRRVAEYYDKMATAFEQERGSPS